MSNKVKVSVIIPVYNTEKYLGDCLNSVCNQTLSNIEIICINDGSTDNCKNILEQYALRDSRIKIIHQENKGLSYSRNQGLEVAKGEFIQFVDSDDMLVENALEYAVDVAERNNLDVFYFDAQVNYESVELEQKHPTYQTYYNRADKYNNVVTGAQLFSMLIADNKFRMAAWLQLSKKSFLDRVHVNFIEGIIHEDNHYTTAIMIEAKRVLHENKKLYIRRIRKDSIMTSTQSFANVYGYYKCAMALCSYLIAPQLPAQANIALGHFIVSLLNNACSIYDRLEGKEQNRMALLMKSDINALTLIILMYNDRLKLKNEFNQKLKAYDKVENEGKTLDALNRSLQKSQQQNEQELKAIREK